MNALRKGLKNCHMTYMAPHRQQLQVICSTWTQKNS